MASILTSCDKRGRRRFRAVVRRVGFPTESRTFDRLKSARQWAAEVEAAMSDGRYTRTNGDESKVADMIERYIATVCPTKKTGDRQAQQLRVWRRHIGNYQVKNIQPRHIADGRDRIAAGRSPATVNRYLAALSHVFTVALRDWQIVSTNPVRSILWPREPRGRVRFLDEAERARLIEAAKTVGLYPLVMLALTTGCRRGELLGLTWSAVDFERRRLILLETKNNERRQVPLMPQAFEIMENLYTLARTRKQVARFSVIGLTSNQVSTRWRHALKAARIKDFRFHDLRHTAASYLAMTGATTNEIAEILGHKTLSMVKRYAHLTTAHSARVLERMGREVFGE